MTYPPVVHNGPGARHGLKLRLDVLTLHPLHAGKEAGQAPISGISFDVTTSLLHITPIVFTHHQAPHLYQQP